MPLRWNDKKRRKQQDKQSKARSLQRGSLSLDAEFKQELHGRVRGLRSAVEERSDILESVGTGLGSPRCASAPSTPLAWGSHTLPSPSSTAAMTSHDLKASRKNMPLRLRQSELEATARSLASCRHYPIQYPGNARTADAKTSTTLQPITPRTAAASANEFSWEDYWEERKQIEKSASPAEDKETDIDEDINERNKEIDISKVRERTQTMKLTAADAAAIMKQVKRINASVKTSPSTSSSSIGTGDHPAVNGKASHGREPDKEPDKELSSSTSALESSAESDQRRGSAAESTVLSQSEYFVCVSGNADTVDPSVPLPELELGREALGVTYMHDLSEADQGKICHVVVLALTALLDTYDLRWKTGRPLKRKGMDVKDAKSKIFGVPLTSMMERDRGLQESITCPLFFTEVSPAACVKHAIPSIQVYIHDSACSGKCTGNL
eukprot:scpid61611/ scgid1307/ 